MGKSEHLGEFEQLALLAVLRLGDGAYGATIQDELDLDQDPGRQLEQRRGEEQRADHRRDVGRRNPARRQLRRRLSGRLNPARTAASFVVM